MANRFRARVQRLLEETGGTLESETHERIDLVRQVIAASTEAASMLRKSALACRFGMTAEQAQAMLISADQTDEQTRAYKQELQDLLDSIGAPS